MLESQKSKIYQQGKESFPAWWIILENLGYFLNWGLGYVLLMPFKYNGMPIVSWIYLIILVIIQVLLKKHNCASCYYYNKWCHLGWGKLSAIFFKQDSGNPDLGIKLCISYILQLPVILVAALIAGFVYGFTILNVSLLVVFVLLNLLQGVVLRKKGCEVCKVRFICKGSAAK